MSVSDLAGMGRKTGVTAGGLRGMHLEDMVRLGGVCEFRLPDRMLPGRVLVPACFHATGAYILANGTFGCDTLSSLSALLIFPSRAYVPVDIPCGG